MILAGIFAARLARDPDDLLAMILMAVCPALVTRASIVIVDTFATFFVLAVLYLCARIQAEPSRPVWICRDSLDAAAKENTHRCAWLDFFCHSAYCGVPKIRPFDRSAVFCLSFRHCASRPRLHFLILSTGRAEERAQGCASA